jgi:hypothetical protein
MEVVNGTFDPQTLAMLKAIFEEAAGLLPLNRRTPQMRLNLASRILRRAAQGELSPAELRIYALMEAASPTAEPQASR